MRFRLFRQGRSGLLPAVVLLLAAAPVAQAGRGPAPADSLRVHELLKTAKHDVGSDTLRRRQLLKQALGLSRRAHYELGQAEAYNELAILASTRADFAADSAYLHHARQVLQALYRRRPTPRVVQLLANVDGNWIVHLQRTGRYAASVQAMLGSLDYLRRNKLYATMVLTYYNIGGTLEALGQTRQAADYWKQGLQLRTRAPQEGVLVLLASGLALHYDADSTQPDSARHYLSITRELAETEAGQRYHFIYLWTQGKHELRHGRPRAAVALLEQSVAEARQRGNIDDVNALLSDLGRGYSQLGDYPQARRYLLESLQQMAKSGMPEQGVLYEYLAEVEEKSGHPAQALRYMRRLHMFKDSLGGVSVRTQLNGLETQYRTREKEQHIRLLQQNQHLQTAELRRQHQLTYGAFALVAALLGVGGLGYAALRNRRQVEQQQQQLQQQKIQELEQERQLLATEAMLRGQEEERSRLARDLHDGLGGMLSTVKLYLGSVRGHVVLPEASAQLFARSLEHLDGSISELRRVARDMMPEALLQFGLVPALRDLCQAVEVGSSGALRVQFQAYGLEAERLPQRTEVVVYRLVQELLNNVLKHAQATEVLVQLMRDGQQVQLVVEDDGRGFDLATVRGGVGLRSIQARVDYLRGTLDLQSAPGQGTTTTIDFYLTQLEPAAPEATVLTAATSSPN